MPFVTYSQNEMLTYLTTTSGKYLSLHYAYSPTGANELSGGSPAYARVVPTWGTAAGGSISTTSIASAFNVPPGSPTIVAWVGIFDALTGGNFQGMGPNGGAPQYGVTAATTGNLFTAPGSSYANGTTVVLFNGAGAHDPVQLHVSGTVYYVVSASGATFSLSATLAGTAITVNAAGAGIVQAITVEQYSAQGTFTVSSDVLTLV